MKGKNLDELDKTQLRHVKEAINKINLALAYLGPGQGSAAAAKPDFAIAAYNLGAVHQEKGAFDLALAHYERALALDPTYADAHWNESLIYLLQGDFAKGLPKYEWRWRRNNAARNPFAAPMWDGGDLNGKSILLHSEQGLGDSLQFIRYASLVKKRGAKVFVYCPAALARLFESAKGIDQIFTEKTPALPGFDCQAPLMSLPWLCGTTLATIPAFAPYLAAPRDARDLWAEKLRPYAGLKIGLVWAGSPRENNPEAYAVDRRRSLRLEMFAPLASLPGIHFFSLQKGDPAKQARTPPQGMELIDLMEEVQDFADTAALIAQLDLVIGVDTSVIHVAGALAKPVWVLSRFDGCWRWLQDRSDSPWYPTLRLFRQKTPRDWAPVIQDVAAALKVFTPADKRTDLS
ncbi:MAG: tetratricopeptide repeat protein [Alphaproteobacteria bacterium]|nr:tetratricopeptide repeat protein [Alphaproteobacteria bacterium]